MHHFLSHHKLALGRLGVKMSPVTPIRLLHRRILTLFGGIVSFLQSMAATPTDQAIAQLPPASVYPIDFKRDVQPILEASCVKCHGRGKANGDWKLDTRATFLKPSESGPTVVIGQSAQSHFIHLVAGTDPDSVMPKKGGRLSAEQIGILRAWVDQGLKWDSAVTFAKPAPNNLTPRLPNLPSGRATHPIDRFLEAYATAHSVKFQPVVSDRVFARRAFLDTIGLLPSPTELEAFLKSKDKDKRGRLVRGLLDDKQRYAQHWLTFWNDLLRNDYKGTGYIDNGRKQITPWLYEALLENRPYDRFVRELVNPSPASEGFSKGIVWRGTVNASMTPPMQAAQNIGQVLMGVNLKCASCHDSFVDDWQLSDAYGLAGIYADGPLEMVLCDKPTGKLAPLRFLFPELGAVNPSAPKSNRLEQLARLITAPENGRLSRTLVNRLWSRLLGRGLVEPLDIMQNTAWSPDLIDWLAEDLVAHHWNLKRTLEIILTSRAYQLPSVDISDKPDPSYVFTGPAVKRLTAEQFRDALGSLTGVWADKPEGGLDRLLLNGGSAKLLKVEAFWIWGDPHAASGVPPGTNGFRKSIVLKAQPSEATVFLHVDNSARVFVNGQRLRGADASDWSQLSVYDARPFLRAGTNVLAVEAINGGDTLNPAGLLVHLRVLYRTGSKEETLNFTTDATWTARKNPSGDWIKSEPLEPWSPASVLGNSGLPPWSVTESLASALSGQTIYGRVRSSLTSADPLDLALGRPNREQVTTVRPSAATTLQALELTNGKTLAQILRRGAETLVKSHPNSSRLTDQLFQVALSRLPTKKERSLTVGLIGQKPSVEGVEDLLWSLAMLPEFQLAL